MCVKGRAHLDYCMYCGCVGPFLYFVHGYRRQLVPEFIFGGSSRDARSSSAFEDAFQALSSRPAVTVFVSNAERRDLSQNTSARYQVSGQEHVLPLIHMIIDALEPPLG